MQSWGWESYLKYGTLFGLCVSRLGDSIYNCTNTMFLIRKVTLQLVNVYHIPLPGWLAASIGLRRRKGFNQIFYPTGNQAGGCHWRWWRIAYHILLHHDPSAMPTHNFITGLSLTQGNCQLLRNKKTKILG